MTGLEWCVSPAHGNPNLYGYTEEIGTHVTSQRSLLERYWYPVMFAGWKSRCGLYLGPYLYKWRSTLWICINTIHICENRKGYVDVDAVLLTACPLRSDIPTGFLITLFKSENTAIKLPSVQQISDQEDSFRCTNKLASLLRCSKMYI